MAKSKRWVANQDMLFEGVQYRPGDLLPADVTSSRAFRALKSMDRIIPEDEADTADWDTQSRVPAKGSSVTPEAAHVTKQEDARDPGHTTPTAPAPRDGTVAEPEPDGGEFEPEDDGEGEIISSALEDLTVAALKDLLRAEDLPVTGKKAVLVARLQAAAQQA